MVENGFAEEDEDEDEGGNVTISSVVSFVCLGLFCPGRVFKVFLRVSRNVEGGIASWSEWRASLVLGSMMRVTGNEGMEYTFATALPAGLAVVCCQRTHVVCTSLRTPLSLHTSRFIMYEWKTDRSCKFTTKIRPARQACSTAAVNGPLNNKSSGGLNTAGCCLPEGADRNSRLKTGCS